MRKTMREITALWNRVCGIIALVLLAMQFIPFWSLPGCDSCGLSKSYSISKFVWLKASDKEMLRFLESKVGESVNVNLMAASSAIMILCLIAGAYLCLKKSESGHFAAIPAIAGIAGILTVSLNPAFRTGKDWIGGVITEAMTGKSAFMKAFWDVVATSWFILLLFCSILIIVAAIVLVYEIKKRKQESIGVSMSASDKAAKITTIRTLTTEVGTKKGSIGIAEANFNKLIAYLSDEDEDCRATAVEMLGKTSKEFAFTHIAHLLETEESEKVANAMKIALKSIKTNIEKQ